MRFFYVISVLKMVSALTWMIHSDSSTQSMLNGHFKASLAKVYGRVRDFLTKELAPETHDFR